MAKALKKTGRDILYSLCSWGEDYVHTWGGSIANSWSVSGDIYDSFARPDDLCSCTDAADPACVAPGTHCSVLAIVNKVTPYIDRGLRAGGTILILQSPLLHVGSPQIPPPPRQRPPHHVPLHPHNHHQTQPSSPLNQDPPRPRRPAHLPQHILLRAPRDGHGIGETHVWSGPLANGDQIVIFLNAADADLDMAASLEDIFMMDGVGGMAAQVRQDWAVHDLWGEGGAGMMRMEDARRAVLMGLG
ncbi:hypothetical protein TgHK011_004021 [Trichoderma gracile]|nr:hypothetical protein TgHK011_004021 [Trichoderma gracile]